MRNGNVSTEKRSTFIPVIVSKPTLPHLVIESNETKQLLVCGGAGRLGRVVDNGIGSGRVTANNKQK